MTDPDLLKLLDEALDRLKPAETRESGRAGRDRPLVESITVTPKPAETLKSGRSGRSGRENHDTLVSKAHREPQNDVDPQEKVRHEYLQKTTATSATAATFEGNCGQNGDRDGKVVSAPRPLSAGTLDSSRPLSRVSLNHAEPETLPLELPKPLRLGDGRRLYRICANDIPESVGRWTYDLCDRARAYDAVLVGDGRDLIVVERWLSELPLETLQELADAAGEVIRALRGEPRAGIT